MMTDDLLFEAKPRVAPNPLIPNPNRSYGMSKETTPYLASLAAKYLGMTDEQLADIPYPQLFDIIRQLAGSVLTQFEPSADEYYIGQTRTMTHALTGNTYKIRDVLREPMTNKRYKFAGYCQYATREEGNPVDVWTPCKEGSAFDEIEPYERNRKLPLSVSTSGHPDPHVEPTNDDQPKDGD
jgi:hypothetical protein